MSVKIYAVRNRTSDLVYVGKTTQTLERRLAHHISSRKSWLKGDTNHCSSFPIVECPTAYIELLEECEVGVGKERERWWMENTPNCVNKLVPNRTTKEYQHQWYLEHKEEHTAKSKAYVEANREKVREYQREYRKANREKLNQQTREWKAKQKLKGAT